MTLVLLDPCKARTNQIAKHSREIVTTGRWHWNKVLTSDMSKESYASSNVFGHSLDRSFVRFWRKEVGFDGLI